MTWKKWRFKYLTFLVISILLAVILAENDAFGNFLLHLGSLEYVGALLAGMLFVSSFTVAISMVIFGILAQDIHPLALGLIGGVGALLGDWLIFKFVRDHLTDELMVLFGKEGSSYVKGVLKSKYIAWLLPILGAFIIASPLPDELGISLLGLSKMSDSKFMLISYVSNAAGILAVASIARVF